MQKVLIIGVSGMLGSSIYRLFASSPDFTVLGTARGLTGLEPLPRHSRARIIPRVDISDFDGLTRLFAEERPAVVVNCVGIIKQLAAAKDPLVSISVNSLFPHRLAQIAAASNSRLIQISTDCVFSGRRGNYAEDDCADAEDLYGRTKLLGEVDYPNAITLRTSIIGHELGSNISLLDWFLSQPGPNVRGYRKAIYTGLPTVELARVIRDVVIPSNLRGLWHVASDPINKFDLLCLIAKVYGKRIKILPDDAVQIDRSLNSLRFRETTGYKAAPWDALVQLMRDNR